MTTPAAQQYLDVLKAAALAFLERHHSEHLSNDQMLFGRAVQHLVNDFDILTSKAEQIVGLALADLHAIRDRQRLDVLTSTDTHSVIVDPFTGIAWAIPVSLIYERIINTPDNGRFRLTHS
ncbi:hypothetical protein [Pseudomonas sp. UBA1879]|uniref:hypothetical protein n=1 Tax=Pseudomonas sp. UBA1879 TaxID=1947305 RepID=UPI0025D273CF|nr:hypothetical protein [Pseudomonas sp. UBA1879]